MAAFALTLAFGAGRASAQVAGSIAVYPQTSSLEVTGTRQFSAYVPISPNTVVWLVNGIQGGNATVGTISATGLYKPPAAIPVNNVFTITARSTAFPTSSGSATLTVTRPYPWLWGVSPSSFPVGQYTVSFNGSNFAPDSQALANGSPVTTTFVSATKLVAKGSAAAVGTIQFAVRQPGIGSRDRQQRERVRRAGEHCRVRRTGVGECAARREPGIHRRRDRLHEHRGHVVGQRDGGRIGSARNDLGGRSLRCAGGDAGIAERDHSRDIGRESSRVRAGGGDARVAGKGHGVAGLGDAPGRGEPIICRDRHGDFKHRGQLERQRRRRRIVGTRNRQRSGAVYGAARDTCDQPSHSSGDVGGQRDVVRAVSRDHDGAAANRDIAHGRAIPGAIVVRPDAGYAGPSAADRNSGVSEPAVRSARDGIPTPSGNSMGALRQWMLFNYTTSPDQLRQRVAYALSQIIVTSGNKLVYADEILPWLRLLSQHAFGNYRDLLRDVSMSASMGKYLDLANSVKPTGASGANENYPRELMQLFTIGLWKLNQDGSQVIGANGLPVSTYDQNTVRQVALALTGWTYATAPGATPRALNWEYFGAPMEVRPANHDTSSKTFLGCSLGANQSVQQDLDATIDCLMQHPNIAPFIATRLIRSLVTSNPSPAYVTRVANVFAGANGGARGDLKATVTAILLDPEARTDTASATQGRLKEPILQTAGLLRAFNGRFSSTNGLVYLYDYMAQAVLAPPSVFSWFSPLYRVPKSPLFGPEFQIYSPTEATLRGNFMYSLLTAPPGDTFIDLSPFAPYGNDMPNLVETANQILLYGRMPDGMRQALIAAATPGYDANTRILTVVYLTALSGQYAVQY